MLTLCALLADNQVTSYLCLSLCRKGDVVLTYRTGQFLPLVR